MVLSRLSSWRPLGSGDAYPTSIGEIPGAESDTLHLHSCSNTQSTKSPSTVRTQALVSSRQTWEHKRDTTCLQLAYKNWAGRGSVGLAASASPSIITKTQRTSFQLDPLSQSLGWGLKESDMQQKCFALCYLAL
jgi:hypothetical protein